MKKVTNTASQKGEIALISKASELLRKGGIWALPDSYEDMKDGVIKIGLRVWPLRLIEKRKGKAPTATIVKFTEGKEKKQGWMSYKIPDSELKGYNEEGGVEID